MVRVYPDRVPEANGPAAPTRLERVRQVANAVNLSTPFGLAVATLGRSRVRRGPRGLVLADGYRLSFPVAGAFTVGNVIITSGDWNELSRRRPRLLAHEERHSCQYAYCLGLPYLPLYALCLAWSWLRTGDRAAANVFERRAGLADGGYREYPSRPLGPVLRGLFRRTPAAG